jgi:DNA-binding response OmpR family regulator
VSKTILVVEDNPDAREMVSLVLTSAGFVVRTAEDGQEALDVVQDWQPDLIITDIQMPKVDGIEMIKRMRKRFKSKAVPIVVMSAITSAVTQEALDAGADDSAPKPMQVRFLLNLVRQLLT